MGIHNRIFGRVRAIANAARSAYVAKRLMREYRAYSRSPQFDPRIPPPALNYNQGACDSLAGYIREFTENASARELPFLVTHAGLRPESTILDYGCGLGRSAYAASNFLTTGRYFGYEPNPEALAFLKAAYAGRPNFQFLGDELRLDDDYVGLQRGKKSASGIDAAQIDLSALEGLNIDIQISNSVFTHMWIPAIENVLRQTCKIVGQSGICVNSWLIVDSFAEQGMKTGIADRVLPYEVNNALTYSLENPLVCTAYRLQDVTDLYRRCGHEIIEICWGSWSGRSEHNNANYQDLVISRPIVAASA
jgi:SAM-dependent methyltransferase